VLFLAFGARVTERYSEIQDTSCNSEPETTKPKGYPNTVHTKYKKIHEPSGAKNGGVSVIVSSVFGRFERFECDKHDRSINSPKGLVVVCVVCVCVVYVVRVFVCVVCVRVGVVVCIVRSCVSGSSVRCEGHCAGQAPRYSRVHMLAYRTKNMYECERSHVCVTCKRDSRNSRREARAWWVMHRRH